MGWRSNSIFPAYDSCVGDIPPRGNRSNSAHSAGRIPVDYRPGDLIFFAGRDPLSRAIALKTCTWRQLLLRRWFSHVGICCEFDDGSPSGPRIMLVESTTLADQPCFITGRKTIGVQAHFPEGRVWNYPGAAWRLRLRRSLDAIESRRLSNFCLSTIGQPYNYRRAGELALFFWSHLRDETPLPDSWFCSDHALTALKTIDRVDQDHDPEDFSPGRLAHLVLKSGAYWPIDQFGGRSFKIK